jgi:hypothetical protein
MAYVCREFDVSPTRMWGGVVIDPETFPRWLVGAEAIRDVDDSWPAVGSRFHHRVGVGPLTLADNSEVLAIDEGAMLRLRVRARPFIAAVVTFRIVGGERTCVVTMEEEPARRIIGNAVRPVLDPMIHVRNHRSLRRLNTLSSGARWRRSPRARGEPRGPMARASRRVATVNRPPPPSARSAAPSA